MSSKIVQLVAQFSVRSLGFLRVLRPNPRAFSSAPVETPKPQPPKDESRSMSSRTHKVDNLERKMLVWTGKYKSADDVPSYINQDVMEKARNKIRIRLANVMMAVTAIGCLIMVWSGKKAAERGESVQKMNLDWHKEYNEQSIAESAAQKSK